MDSNKLGSKVKNAIFGKKEEQPKEALTPADVNFTKDDPPVDQSTPPVADPPTEDQPAAALPEEKTMNYKWKFDFVITTGIMRETITQEVFTEIDSERVAFGLALNKIIGSEKYKGSTGVPRYTQKFTKEKITNE